MIQTENKIISYDSIVSGNDPIFSQLSRPLVFTNGCFDILHRGHVSYLQTARNKGNSLVVGVNSDSSVRRQNKGDDRPINGLTDRMVILAALQCVDAVIAFDEDTPEVLIHAVQPEHLAKGGDWEIDAIVGADFVISSGGKVHSIEFEYNRSTSQLLKNIRSF